MDTDDEVGSVSEGKGGNSSKGSSGKMGLLIFIIVVILIAISNHSRTDEEITVSRQQIINGYASEITPDEAYLMIEGGIDVQQQKRDMLKKQLGVKE